MLRQSETDPPQEYNGGSEMKKGIPKLENSDETEATCPAEKKENIVMNFEGCRKAP